MRGCGGHTTRPGPQGWRGGRLRAGGPLPSELDALTRAHSWPLGLGFQKGRPDGEPWGRGVPTWHEPGRGFEGPVPGVRARRSSQNGKRASEERQGCGAETQHRHVHLVTRSSSKALMPWAAFSRVSSLAGGPCPIKHCHVVAGTRIRSPYGPSMSLWAPLGLWSLSLGLLEQLGHVGGPTPDTWAQSCSLGSGWGPRGVWGGLGGSTGPRYQAGTTRPSCPAHGAPSYGNIPGDDL